MHLNTFAIKFYSNKFRNYNFLYNFIIFNDKTPHNSSPMELRLSYFPNIIIFSICREIYHIVSHLGYNFVILFFVVVGSTMTYNTTYMYIMILEVYFMSSFGSVTTNSNPSSLANNMYSYADSNIAYKHFQLFNPIFVCVVK